MVSSWYRRWRRFTEMKEQSELHTGLGRAEILLTPGVLLRVGENSSVKMLDNRLVSTRVEFVSGIAMLEMVDAGSTVKDPPGDDHLQGFSGSATALWRL